MHKHDLTPYLSMHCKAQEETRCIDTMYKPAAVLFRLLEVPPLAPSSSPPQGSQAPQAGGPWHP